MITPSNPQPEVTRQKQRMTREQFTRRAVWVALVLFGLLFWSHVMAMPFHEPIAAPATCYSTGC